MRIGIDGLILSEPLTGIGHYTLELVRHLARTSTEDEFLVVSSRPFIRDLNSESENRTNLRFVQAKTNPITRHWWSIGLPRYIHQTGIEIFHGTNFEVPLRCDCPTVITIHDLSPLLYPETQERRVVKRSRRRLSPMARAATMVITETEAVRQEVHSHLKIALESIVAVPIAARDFFRPIEIAQTLDVRKRLGISAQFLLYVGTLEPRKNLLTLVRAFEDIITKCQPGLQLVLAGRKGWIIDDLFKYVKRSPAAERIIFTGYLSDEELRALYSSCALFIYPSLYEGFGLPPLEAMACGAPVVASRIPSIEEVVGPAARLVDPQSVPQLIGEITEILADKRIRDRLVDAGRQRVAQFSWDKAASEVRAVYKEALERFDREKR